MRSKLSIPTLEYFIFKLHLNNISFSFHVGWTGARRSKIRSLEWREGDWYTRGEPGDYYSKAGYKVCRPVCYCLNFCDQNIQNLSWTQQALQRLWAAQIYISRQIWDEFWSSFKLIPRVADKNHKRILPELQFLQQVFLESICPLLLDPVGRKVCLVSI